MAKLFLDSTDTNYTVSNSNFTIYGASSSQTISINSSITGIVVDANVEGVQFSDALSTYKFKQTGNRLEVYANDGTTLISKIGLQGDSNGTQLIFSNGAFEAKYAPSGSSLHLTIGGQIVDNTIPSIVTIPTAFNLTSASENITGTAGDDIVNVGAFTATGTYALDTGNDTINALTGANIAGVNSGAATTAESLVMAGIVTMTAPQYAGFSTITAAGASDHIVLTTQATGLTLNPSIETFTLGNFANSVTLAGTGQVVIGGTGADSITSGAGSDTITGGLGSDVFKFLTAPTNGKDTITDFVSGVGGDVLDVTAFDPTAHFNLYSWSPSNIALITVNTNGTINANDDNNPTASTISTPRTLLNHSLTVVNIVDTVIATKDYSSTNNFVDIFGISAKAFSTTAQTAGGNDKAVILVEGTDQTQVYFAQDTHTNGTWEAADLTLVAVLTGTNNTGATWNAANFLPFLIS
jgi:Ca2+-binding RTX toxin-like protein